MSHTYTTQDGKTAVPVNPYVMIEPFKGDANTVNHREVLNRLFKLREFAENNMPIPLTTERPDLIGKDFSGEVVEQGSDDKINWYCEDLGYYQYFRQALSVPVKGEEKLCGMQIVDRVRIMVEDMQDRVSEFFIEVAKEYTGNPMCEVKTYNQTDDRLSLLKIDDRTVATVIESRTDFNNVEWIFSKLHTHATNDANLVPLDKVINELECCKELTKIDIDVLIQRIKNLRKE